MLVKPGTYVRPTDNQYRFPLRALDRVQVPAQATVTDMAWVLQQVMSLEDAARFEAGVGRWSGPEDALPDGTRPYVNVQRMFVECGWPARISSGHVEDALRGVVQVFRGATQVDLVMRDHHMLDAALYVYATTGALPRRVLHADRHSDWADDRHLRARRPDQAATWWALFHGLKRPDGAAALEEQDIHFFTAMAEVAGAPGRNIGAHVRVPGFLDPSSLDFASVVQRMGATPPDWVSLDLDCFQPAAQLRAARDALRDPQLAHWMRGAAVRVFCLSPQFTRGGDRFADWRIHGSRSSSLRLINALRT